MLVFVFFFNAAHLLFRLHLDSFYLVSQVKISHLNLNLPGTPYTSERVLRGVRVEMARKKNMRENKMRDK